ncbi:hypothetical protein HY969_01925 [Candidatus Kaiserbacteria bacterium]|nr:hypothetical protein [Candidatus Kaiserbacteria bacterium]
MDTKSLESVGLTEKAAKIYLAGLTLGTTTVQEIARKTGLKRPTVYLHLDELVRRNFFEKVSLNKKEYYRAADPRVLETQIKQRLSELQTIMPKLASLQANTLGRPQVQMFEGEEGIRRVYEEVKNSNNWRIWSNLSEIYTLFSDTYADISESVRRNGIGVREIIADTKESRRYSRLLSQVCGPTYTSRIATVAGLENDTFIYGNCVAIFRLHEFNMFVVRIEDKTIADSMKALFDMAWKSAKPFK